MPVDVVEGWTGRIEFTLLIDGAPGNFSATGHTPSLVLYTKSRAAVNIGSSQLAWLTATCGHLAYTPELNDFRASQSPYTARFRVSDTGGVVFFPNGKPDIWTVYAP